MIIVKGRPGPMSNPDPQGSMRDYNVLRDIDSLQTDLDGVEYTQTMSIVTVMKMISANVTVPVPGSGQTINMSGSFWDIIMRLQSTRIPLAKKQPGQIAIDVFYNSISPEMRGMMMTQDYSRTLIYVFQPAIDTEKMRVVVNKINKIIEDPDHYTMGEKTSGFTGTGPLLVEVNDLLMLNSYQSLAVAFLLIFMILYIVFNRSLRFTLITMIPISAVVALEPLILKIIPRFDPLNPSHIIGFGIDLNLFTAIIASVIVGLGIDFSIHITERVREGNVTLASVARAVNTSGRSFTEATITMIVGLATIFIVPISSVWEFVELIITMLVFSVFGALLVLPSAYTFVIKDLNRAEGFRRDIHRGPSKLWKKLRGE